MAASSVVPRVDLEAGVARLRAEGFDVRADARCFSSHFTYAGTDAERAASFWDAATDPDVDVVWMARGGYGAGRILPLLVELARLEHRRETPCGCRRACDLHERRHASTPKPRDGQRRCCYSNRADPPARHTEYLKVDMPGLGTKRVEQPLAFRPLRALAAQ